MKKKRWIQIGCVTAAACVIGSATLMAGASETLDVEGAVAGVAVPLNNYFASSLNPEEELSEFLNSDAILNAGQPAEAAAQTEAPTEAETQAQTETQPEAEQQTEAQETEAPTETEAVQTQAETETEAPTETETVSPYADIAVSHVRENSYVNVRSEPNTTSEVLGKLYNDCAATILATVDGEGGQWYEIKSGSVQGYIKAEYFLTGDEAEARAIEIGKLEGRVNTNGLRLRSEPSLDSEILTLIWSGETYVVLETGGEFVKIMVDEDLVGYVYAEMIDVDVKFDTAISLEEEQKQKEEEERKKREAEEAQRRLEEAKKQQAAAESAAAEAGSSESGSSSSGSSSASSEVTSASRDALVSYAKQWVGVTPYVYGGTSLENGADCSGFTQAVYRNALGVSIPRDSRSQASGSTTISESELQPGDLVFYNSGGGAIDHVAIYIGGGQVVHASNSRVGTIISNMKYREPCQYGRYIN